MAPQRSQSARGYVAKVSLPALPPPIGTSGLIGWLRQNLFYNLTNSLMTIFTVVLLWLLVSSASGWFVIDAVMQAGSKQECLKIDSGACWAVIGKRIEQFMFGFYPEAERWRPLVCFLLLFVAIGPLLLPSFPARRQMLWFSAIYPVLTGVLLLGGAFGLPPVKTALFGGFMLTLIVGVTGIAASLPLGILLALGRQSKLLAVRTLSVMFIEFMRGVPLITLLFVASTMLNYFLPPGTHFDLLLRVLIMVTFFSAAYIAEVIRGGLQAIPAGQYEAAQSIGLNYWQTTRLVTLPQALKISIPGIVNTFIGLYKDTTLVIVIGLLDPLGIGRAALADANWNGLSNEIYLFVALFFFVSCFAMSRYSLWLEKRLATEHR
ncbi:MAG: amino acid ABC transporter permease [Candidatus Puniceispirillum sp.]|nr:amino acid ABC transporter permease [Candidatus Puniceispirillum sp.]MBL6774800.1 amino acid ABC transporter permease [Candidatus Puniceispirillum sp.]